MKTSTRDILFILVGLFVSIGTLWASRAGVETRLGKDVAYLNTVGRSPAGERSLSQSLESQFKPHAGQIADLRKQRLGYGDISVVLAVASRLRGGVSKQNIERIVTSWKSPRSGNWAKVARSFGVRVEHVVLQIENLKPGTPTRAPMGATASRSGASPSTASRSKGYDPVLRLVHGG